MTAPTNNVFTPLLAMSSIINAASLLEMRSVNSSTGQPQYVFWSPISNANPAFPVWFGLKFYVDGNGFINRQQLPNAGEGFKYIFNDYASYFS